MGCRPASSRDWQPKASTSRRVLAACASHPTSIMTKPMPTASLRLWQSAPREWEEKYMKHVYVPRMTPYGLNPDDELNDLRMSDQVRPLYDHVKKFIRETVEPMSVEFYRHGEKKTDRWSFTPGQIEVLEKAKAKSTEFGLGNFFLPAAETGHGLQNL